MSSVAETRVCECGAELPEVSVMGFVLPLSHCHDCSERKIAEETAEARIRDTERALNRAGMTPRLLAQTLDATDADLTTQLEQAREWLDAFRSGTRQNLWLAGDVGTGKSWIAWGLIRELVLEYVERCYADEQLREYAAHPPALFVNWRDLLNDLRDEYREGQGGASGLYKRGCHVTVLALDDLGAERPTAWALEALAGLVQARYDNCLPTIVTSNFSTAELTERLSGDDEVVGRRIVNRLVEGGVGIRFDGASRRRAG